VSDVTSISPASQIRDISNTNYQASALENGISYYFAITAVGKSDNENKQVTCVAATPTVMPQGTADPDMNLDIYAPDRVWAGTTLFGDNHNLESPRIIEVNMLGQVIWKYSVPLNFRRPTGGINPGFDAELLPNNNILFVSPGKGVYEIDRKGNVVWSYLDAKVSHCVERLPNGNTLVVFGDNDQKNDAQVKEVNPKGEIVWAWYAKDHFDKPPYISIFDGGWTHTNAASRLSNGDTLISLRNFHFVVEVNPKGEVVRTIGEGVLGDQHDPEMLPNGNLIATTSRAGDEQTPSPPVRAVEIDAKTGKIIWQFLPPPGLTVPPNRDADRLPNGNTLFVGAAAILEVTPQGEIVWQLSLKTPIAPEEGAARGFYKAERIATQG
jgi:hypothetical protein